MYPLSGSILRPDLYGVVEEAALMSESFIGLRAVPPLPVPTKSGQYPVIQRSTGNLLRNEVKRRGPTADYARISRATTTDTYDCVEYGIEELVDDSESRNYSRFFPVESKVLTYAYRQIQIAHEIRANTLLWDRATWTATTSGTAYTAANRGSFDIGLDIDICKQAIMSRGESVTDLTLVMSLPQFNLIRSSTLLQNRIRGTISTDSLLLLDRQAVADALSIREVLVGAASYDSSNQGQASSMTQCWSDTLMWLGNIQPAKGPGQYFSGGAAYTLFWEQDAALIQVETYREENRRSEVIRARQYTSEKVVLSNGGQLLATGA